MGVPESFEVLAARAQAAHESLVTMKRESTKLKLVMGKLLREIQRDRLYAPLGFNSFEEYLMSPEVDIAERTARRWMGVVAKWEPLCDPARGDAAVTLDDVVDIGISKADRLGPIVERAEPEEIPALVAQGKTLNKQDLRAELAHYGTNVTPADEYAEYLQRRLVAMASRVRELNVDRLDVLDKLIAAAMEGRAKLADGVLA